MATATTNEDRRPPLAPLDTSQQRERSIRMDQASDVSELHHASLFDFGESEFELMHVTVTVHGLTGIVSERSSKRKKKPTGVPSTTSKGTKSTTGSAPNDSVSSSLTSTDVSSAEDGTVETEKNPTTAILTFSRNVSNSETTISTHLPSLPLGLPTSKFGIASRYTACWQEPKSILLRQEEDIDEHDHSSFTFLRVMMREPILPGTRRDGNNMSTYVHETIDLHINLLRGKEMIPLGIATVAISGDEEGPVPMNLPAKPVILKGKKLIVTPSDKKKGIFKKKQYRRPAFPSDPTLKFTLEENAILRVTIHVIPHEAIKDAESRKLAREMQLKMHLEKLQDENSIVPRDAKKTKSALPEPLNHSCTPKISTPLGTKQVTKPFDARSAFFCGKLCDVHNPDTSAQKDENVQATKTSDYTIDNTTIDDRLREQYGYTFASSVLSSVSESESDSDVSEGDIHLNRKIVVPQQDTNPGRV